MQGRIDRPDYRTAMTTSINGFPIDTGAWVRRPGFSWSHFLRGGLAGRVIAFSFKNTTPYTMEFTDNHLRFSQQQAFVTTNDDVTVSAATTASPIAVTTGTHGWSSNDQVYFYNLGTSVPAMHRRVCIITVTGATAFTLKDAITGANLDGGVIGTIPAGAKVARILDIATTYNTAQWRTLRSVQAETKAVLLQGATPPQVLEATAQPTAINFATFTLSAANLTDGPYQAPLVGSLTTPSAVNGNITLTFSFQAYDSTRSYNVGDFVSNSSVSYSSLQGGNVGNTPASSPTFWKVVNGGAAVGPNGFTASDVGRHIRLFSEPAAWAVGTAYTAGLVVKYNSAYWLATASSTGVIPGSDATKWAPYVGVQAARWTWGKILTVSGAGLINPALSGVVNIGNMTGNGGLSAAFDGTLSKTAAASASAVCEDITPSAFVPGTIYSAGQIATYLGTKYIASAPATAAWTTAPVTANTIVVYNGQYYKCAAVPQTWVSKGS